MTCTGSFWLGSTHTQDPEQPHPAASDPEQVTWKPASSAGTVIKCQTRQGITTASHMRLATDTRELETVLSLSNIATLLCREHA
jgi:hypothetical protein